MFIVVVAGVCIILVALEPYSTSRSWQLIIGCRRLATVPSKKAAGRLKIGLGAARGEELGSFHSGHFLGNRPRSARVKSLIRDIAAFRALVRRGIVVLHHRVPFPVVLWCSSPCWDPRYSTSASRTITEIDQLGSRSTFRR